MPLPVAQRMKSQSLVSPSVLRVVAIAASTGGQKALSRIFQGLPSSLSAAILVVQHLDPNQRSAMAENLARYTALTVKEAEAQEWIENGTAYIAPPDHHLLVNWDGSLMLKQTPKVNFLRPSADVLFRSVAASYGYRAIAVVLTGTGDDGAFGVQAIKKQGGLIIAQDKATSECFGMPKSAIKTGVVDWILPLEKIAPILQDWVQGKQIPSHR